METKTILQNAIRVAGSQEKLGTQLGCSQNAIYAALKSGRVSPLMARRLDEWSGGAFPRNILREDIFGPWLGSAPIEISATTTEDGTVVVVDTRTGISASGRNLPEAYAELRRLLAGRKVAA